MKLWVGNKRLQGELSNVFKFHEENSYIDSGVRTKERRKEGHEKHWKGGWIEEVNQKSSSRQIELTQ